MISQPAIEVKNLSKKFRLWRGKESTLKSTAVNLLKGKKLSEGEFWALKDINLKVRRGETLGIIGPNGSGKTTLLKILAGILYPTSGSIEVSGKVSTLFELGTGFHPELTGRENVFLNGTILGLSRKEVAQRFDKIVEFSGLEKFIDMPLKHYSSGMQVRLAFSVAINVDPEILLVDEVLAVGDASFQNKSFSAFDEFKRKGITIVFVSHDLSKVREFCDRVVFLRSGAVEFSGDPRKAVDEYLRRVHLATAEEVAEGREEIEKRTGAGIDGVKCYSGGKEAYVLRHGEDLSVEVSFHNYEEVSPINVGVALYREDGAYCYGTSTIRDKVPLSDKEKGKARLEYRKLPLLPGSYQVVVSLLGESEKIEYDLLRHAAKFEVLGGRELGDGMAFIDHKWRTN